MDYRELASRDLKGRPILATALSAERNLKRTVEADQPEAQVRSLIHRDFCGHGDLQQEAPKDHDRPSVAARKRRGSDHNITERILVTIM